MYYSLNYFEQRRHCSIIFIQFLTIGLIFGKSISASWMKLSIPHTYLEFLARIFIFRYVSHTAILCKISWKNSEKLSKKLPCTLSSPSLQLIPSLVHSKHCRNRVQPLRLIWYNFPAITWQLHTPSWKEIRCCTGVQDMWYRDTRHKRKVDSARKLGRRQYTAPVTLLQC